MPDEIVVEQPVEALAIPERPAQFDAMALARAPKKILEEAHKAARALTEVLSQKKKKITLNGKQYLQFEDWQTLGRFYGVTVIARSTNFVEYGDGDSKVAGFEAKADALLVGNNQVISSAEALCLNDETNWKGKPLFQLKSMAQTRACAKALRNVLAWVVVLAGYAPTPAEEMSTEIEVANNEAFNDATSDNGLPEFQVNALTGACNESNKTPEQIKTYLFGINKVYTHWKDLSRKEFLDALKWARMPLGTASAKEASSAQPEATRPTGTISAKQEARLFAIGKKAGHSEAQVKELVGRYGYEHAHEIHWKDYDKICNELEGK